MDVAQLTITRKNILGWLALLRKLECLDEDVNEGLDKYLSRTDKIRRQREIDKLFEEGQW